MPRFLDTRGKSQLTVFICDRCKMKRPIDEQMSDGNLPGLKVCARGCSDNFDPYRLAPRQPEKISVRFPRPDSSVAVTAAQIAQDNAYTQSIDPGTGLIEQTNE